MKISAIELDCLQFAVAPLDTLERRRQYAAGDYPRAERTKDLWRRYRWDLYWDCDFRFDYGRYNDEHIDTALRKAIPPDGLF
jgi:hypothetical protein